MTIPRRRAAAAAALALTGTMIAAGCGSGDQSSGAPTAASPSSPSSTARSTGPTGGSSAGASPSGRASSSPVTGGASSAPTEDRQEDKAAQQRADRKRADRKKAERHRKQVRERKRLITACVHDTRTLNEAVSTYNTAVSSGDQDDLDYAAAVLREAAGTLDHQAERAGNHRLTRLSDRVVDDLGTIASLLEQGEDVPSSSGDSLTGHSRKLHSYCSGKL